MSGLKDTRADEAPKCANCEWWTGDIFDDSGAFCTLHKTLTLDLAVCSDHEPKRG
jgi:hypothetical protein